MLLIIIALYVAFGIVAIAARCFTEWFVARFFIAGHVYNKLIILTNLISGIILLFSNISPVFFPIFFAGLIRSHMYFQLLAITEIPIAICKYFIYRRKMIELTTKECLGYTVVASAASLIVAILLGVVWSLLLTWFA